MTLADTILGAKRDYSLLAQLPTKSEYFEIDPKTRKITQIKPSPPFVDNYMEWRECKRWVWNLPANFMDILTQKSKEGKVDKRRLSGGHAFTVESKYKDFKVELDVVESDTGEIKRAWYIAYNRQKNVCFIRDLLNIEL